MACPCLSCVYSQPNQNHNSLIESAFTTINPIGLLTITPIASSIEAVQIRMRVNKYHAVLNLNESVTLPTKTQDDVLEIALYRDENMLLIGLGSIFLNQYNLSGNEITIELESVIEQIPPTVTCKLFYTPNPKNTRIDLIHIYRKSFIKETRFKYFLQVNSGEVKQELTLKDGQAAYRDYVWHYVASVKPDFNIEFVFKEIDTSRRKLKVLDSVYNFATSDLRVDSPYYISIESPSDADITCEFYLIPTGSDFLNKPHTKLTLTFHEQKNQFLKKYENRGTLDIELKSTKVRQSNARTEEIVKILAETYDDDYSMEFTTYDQRDKLVFKLHVGDGDNKRLNYIGITQLFDLSGLKFGVRYPYCVQLGPENIEFSITCIAINKTQVDYDQINELDETTQLIYKNPQFYNISDLMQYKINRIDLKNQHLQV